MTDPGARPATVGAMPLDIDAVFRGAAMGLPLSGANTMELLSQLREAERRAEAAEAALANRQDTDALADVEVIAGMGVRFRDDN